MLMAISSVEKAKPEKIETEQRAEKPVAKKAQTPPRGSFFRLNFKAKLCFIETRAKINSTQDLEADLLNSGSDLDDLEIGDEIDDDELFS